MKHLAWRGTALTGLLLLGAAPAQRDAAPLYLESGIFTPDESAKVRMYAGTAVTFTLRRVLSPEGLLLKSKDPRSPVLPAGAQTQLVKTVTSKSGTNTVDLGRLPSGVYLLSAGKLSSVVLVSSLGLVVKRDANTALTYSADLQSGQVRESKVWSVGTGNGNAQATQDGQARFKISGVSKENQLFVARAGDDWAVSGQEWRSYAQENKVRGYVYTDRPVYRPGQHVDFKGVLRLTQGLKPFANQEVTVTVTSPDNEQVFRKTLKTNAFGSVSAGFDLSAASRVGSYRFDVRAGGERINLYSSFQVEAYQKPEYEVTITPSVQGAVQGDKVRVKVAAKYLFGGVVSGGRVKYRVTREPTYSYWWMEYGDDARPDYSEKLITQEDTRLNENGELEILLPLERDRAGRTIRYRVEAEVEDEARRPFGAQTTLTAYPASLTVNASVNGYVFDAGDAIPVTLSTQDLKGNGQATTVTLELVRDNWERAESGWKHTREVMLTKQVKTDTTGKLSTTVKAPRGGGYQLRATVRDAQGRKTSSEEFLWVFKPGESWDWYSRELSVKFAKAQYNTGDTATVLITNPNPGSPVLLALEGEKLRSSVVLRGKGAVLRYDFKVTEDMSPNVYVGAASFKGGQLYQGEESVDVTRQDAKLSVSVQAAKAKYAPGDQGTFNVSVKDASGKGVASELALSIVDQAIYLIRPDMSLNMLSVFEMPRDNVVGTTASTEFRFRGVGVYPLARPTMSVVTAQSAPMAAPPPAPSATGNAAQPAVTPRVDFKDTLLWIPNLITDAGGNATVTVKFPDNLTTWVSTARAQTVAPRFGEATGTTMTTKDVIARLSLPVFLVRGDQVTLSGIVNNTLSKPLTGNAVLNAGTLKGLGGAALNPQGTPLNIAALGRQRFDVTVGAKTLGQSQVTFTARTPMGNDALRLPVPVKARGYDMTATSVGGPGTTMNFTLPADTAPESVKLRLDLTPSLLSAVAPALEYLIGYPYGCTEQTMSRFLPALLARQTLGETGLPSSIRRNLDEYTDVGLARIAKFQHQDGGWNFWEHDDSTLEMTAYVVEGLLRAKAVGAPVNNAMLDRGLKYLAQNVNDKDATQAERARTYRVLTMTNRVKVQELLTFAEHKDLQPYALAQVALALHDAKQKQAALAVLNRLKAARKGSGALVYWEKPNRQSGWYWYWDDNSIQVTAAALEALGTLEPGSALIPRTAQWLLRERRGQKWISTQDTTSVIIAALKLKPAAATPSTNVQVLINGKNAGSIKLEGRNAATFHLTKPLAGGQHTINLKGAPAGLIASAALNYSREPATLTGITDKGLLLTRTYERLTPKWDKANRRYEYSKTPLLQSGKLQTVTVGDLIKVTLNIEIKNTARYLLVSDPIPAGMKALDDRSLVYAGEQPRNDWWGWWYWYSGRDLLDDRVDLYADYLPSKNKQTMTYVMRAQTPGTFTALPAHAFLMYDPDVQGYGPAATFTVVDRKE